MAEKRNRESISADYQAARDASDAMTMRRFQNEEACLVLLAILERLAAEPASFIHRVALKGGILMAGELHSPRSSADIDATTGRQRRIDPERVIVELRRAGRAFDLRLYLVESGWHLDPADLHRAVDTKLALTRHRRWRSGLWRMNLETIERAWDETMGSWLGATDHPPT